MPINSCDGRCCAAFIVPKISHTKLAEGLPPFPSKDEAYIWDMLIPITATEGRIRNKKITGVEPTLDWETDGTENYLYTCKHWDEQTHLCKDYENRPYMCRSYPNHGVCQFGCGNIHSLMEAPVQTVRKLTLNKP
jgi:Fe-S-cluster containining protein